MSGQNIPVTISFSHSISVLSWNIEKIINYPFIVYIVRLQDKNTSDKAKQLRPLLTIYYESLVWNKSLASEIVLSQRQCGRREALNAQFKKKDGPLHANLQLLV